MAPSGASVFCNKEETEFEYSFALEYSGPPHIAFDLLPLAFPVDVKRIPTASLLSSISSLSRHDQSSLPVIEPIVAVDSGKNKKLKHSNSASPTSVIAFEESGDPTPNGGSKPNDNISSTSESNCSDQKSCEFDGDIEVLEDCEEKLDSYVNIRPNHGRRVSFVTLVDEELSASVHDDLSTAETDDALEERRELEARAKRGLCYMCLKGNRFTEKEACIVCNAKYCGNCVLKAMGSMPEGRKCLSCIGYRIDESKRGRLGKCSRMLKRLLSKLETTQIMQVEKFCEVNQLHPDSVYVNGKQLSQDEFILLQNCPNPPPKLEPGSYWYDKLSGLWGKEGQKPCKIISPHLNICGDLKRNASNGDTNVTINGREITKVELRMLWWAGVQCAGISSFWLDEYGGYREEGQKKLKGNLWASRRIKLICAVLSLPTPFKVAIHSAEEVNKLVSGAFPEYLKQRKLQKLLLVGFSGSGSSTIYKQAKLLYGTAEPFSKEERQDFRLMIQKNVYHYLVILLESRECFEEEDLTEMRNRHTLNQANEHNHVDGVSIYSIAPKLRAFSEWLLKIFVSGNLGDIFPAASGQYAPLVEELWKDNAIQATYKKARELQILPSVAGYFLERVADISSTDYEPLNMDILYAEGISSHNGLACMNLSFPQPQLHGSADAADEHDPLLRYQLIRVHSKDLLENCKLLEMFEGFQLVIFCVALSDYDQFCDDGTGTITNKMLASKRLFEGIVTHPAFAELNFLLMLNKFDVLEEKIEHVPLSKCSWFNEFTPLISRHNPDDHNNFSNYTSPALQAFQYIAVKFKKLFHSLTNRKLYISLVKGLDSKTVDEALRYSREILRWEARTTNFGTNENSYVSSTEASSFS